MIGWLAALLLGFAGADAPAAGGGAAGGAVAGAGVNHALVAEGAPPPTLSAFGFFAGSAYRPAEGLIPYALRTPLFTDYAEKHRWIVLPPGQAMQADGNGLIRFPVGTAIIKNFGYRDAAGMLRTIETRLLLHRADGWIALPYIWRADGTDADLRLAGGRQMVSFTDPAGNPRTISYAVPNRNQCRNCHQRAGALSPIGPELRNLELAHVWRGRVAGADWTLPRMARWDDQASGTLAERARAYLAVNCAHCHRADGSASNSGLFLEYERADGFDTGIWRRPVAAGRGSGGRAFDIAPGDPDGSILPYRMASTDPGIAMPELGRALAHEEGVALIRAWIAAMSPTQAAGATGHGLASPGYLAQRSQP